MNKTQTNEAHGQFSASQHLDANDPDKLDSDASMLGPDGKPCRACTDFKTWAKNMKKGSDSSSSLRNVMAASSKDENKKQENTGEKKNIQKTTKPDENLQERNNCPLDREELGRNTWGFLHTMAAYFPEDPTLKQQREMKNFVQLFAKFYPCEWCAYHLKERLQHDEPDTTNNKKLSEWFCDYHNEVNRRLGKKEFDCSKVLERWKEGWADGSCD